jgi:hypothetical protein
MVDAGERNRGKKSMPDKWTLTWTDGNGRLGTKTFDKETDFASIASDRLSDLRASNISAVLPDGAKLDEQALRGRFMK